MKHIMVTGSNGMIGSQVVKKLLENGYMVTGISAESTSKVEHKNYSYISMDLTNYKELQDVFQNNKFTHVIHLAAIAHSIRGIKISWSRYYRINTLMSKQIFELATEHSIPIFFSSTVDVYGIQEDVIDEQTVPNPIGFYGKSKVLAEKALMEIAKQPYLIARFAPVYTEANKKDIYRRYYIKYPKLAYLMNKGMDYEFLSSDLAISVITQWVDCYESMHGILNVVDKSSHNTKKLLEKDMSNGNKPVVLKIPKSLYKLMILTVNMLFYKLPFYKFSAYKIFIPMRFDNGKLLKFLK